MRKYYVPIAVSIVIMVFAVGLLLSRRLAAKPEEVHYHAGFLVYKDGKQVDFSDFKYMHIEACGEEQGEKTPEEEQLEKAHLHDGVADVVHVHRNGATWGDLFRNINYSIDTPSMKGYINGEPADDLLTKEIKPYDSMILVIGEEKSVDISKRVDKEHILEVEKKSELCAQEQ